MLYRQLLVFTTTLLVPRPAITGVGQLMRKQAKFYPRAVVPGRKLIKLSGVAAKVSTRVPWKLVQHAGRGTKSTCDKK